SCALTTAGGVKCWGSVAGSSSTLPVDVATLTSGVASLSAGSGGACAVTTDGRVKCWGSGFGPVVNGVATAVTTPVEIAGLTGTAAVAVGTFQTCALASDGAVRCWAGAASPAVVAGLGSGSGAVTISAGEDFRCVLLDTGAVKCWGANDSGQLGDASGVASPAPMQIPGLASGAVAVTAGQFHACAEMADGTSRCWGSGAAGMLGNGSTVDSPNPVTVSALNLLVTPDFAIGARQNSASVSQGSTASYTVDLIPLNGFTDLATFGVTGLPQGATGTFQPSVIAGSGSTSLSVVTPTGTPAGTYTLTIIGVSGTQAHSTSVSMIVAPPPQPDFLLSTTPTNVSVAQGSASTASVSVSTLNGYSASTTLSISGLPAGATATFAPTSVTGAGSSTLTVATAASTPAGSYTVTITGTSGSLVHTTALTLVVTAGTGGQPNGDVPLPAWALWLLGAALLAPLRQAGRRAC
ncbi:MAG: hypothetical protein K2Y02_04620, partial [Burkholderiaceae bacterium]|nr:hypothetical protein [Burkholderiaceae bacterium]